MDIIKADFVVTTPMFLGAGSAGAGKQPDCADTIRGSSIKGALRAAYRALNWSRVRLAAGNDEQALRQLHADEAVIFGSAAKDEKGGQASFLLRVKSSEIKPQREISGNSDALKYLLGMGLYHFRNGMLRDHIPAETAFILELAIKPSLSLEQKQQLQDCLLFWGLTGGLGSRARKGFGSVSMTSLTVSGKETALPTTKQEYGALLQQLLGKERAPGIAPFTAVSQQTSMQISGEDRNALELLKRHGREMAMYRGYGRNGKTLGQPAEQNFRNDHDWAYALSKREADASYLPKRTVFGLPHPYYLSGANFNVAVDAAMRGNSTRRASPLFAHVHRLPNGQHLLLHTLYRSQFLPDSLDVQVKTKAQSYTLSSVDKKIDWSVLDRFLDRFTNREVIIHG